MVVDTSALLAVFFLEPEKDAFLWTLHRAPLILMSAANFLETAVRLDSRRPNGSSDLDRLAAGLRIRVEPVTLEQVSVARSAFRSFGEGRHEAALGFGQCLTYALAHTNGLPVLFKDRRFALTDVTPVHWRQG